VVSGNTGFYYHFSFSVPPTSIIANSSEKNRVNNMEKDGIPTFDFVLRIFTFNEQ
jgi:hypothetical protein